MPINEPAVEEPVAKAVIAAILTAADPVKLLKESLHVEHDKITAGSYTLSLPDDGRLMLIAIGKAAAGMTQAALDLFNGRIQNGLVTLLPGQDFEPPKYLKTFDCGHPLPTEGSLAAGAYAADMLADTSPEDRLLVLVSGGGSAMFELLPPEISLGEVRHLTTELMNRGIPIHQLNVVRQALSLVKGGGLARMAAPALTIGLILSDVVGNPLPFIASGPTTQPRRRGIKAQALLEELHYWDQLSVEVKDYLRKKRSLDPLIFQPANVLLGGNELAVSSAQVALEAQGFETKILSTTMQGEASQIGRRFAHQLREIEAGQALLMGGETTVTVTGSGRGGPNQELALAAALELEGGPTRHLLALATDGIDGNSQAAGAMVNQGTASAIRSHGMDPESRLEDNDSNAALSSVNALLVTGPTGTNLNDVIVGWHPVGTAE